MFGKFARRTWYILALATFVGGCGTREPSLCSFLPGTAQEIAATPRENENLELLALTVSDGVTAEESVYRRLVRDVTAIRAQEPAVRKIGYRGSYLQGLYIALDDASFAQFQAGKFRAWDCLNRHFGVRASSSSSTMNSISLEFKGRFNMEKLAVVYGKVKGVRFAEPVRPIGGASTIHVTPDKDVWHYVFDNASGDCLAGCYEHDAYYFSVGGDGRPTFGGRWESARDSRSRPDWVDRYMWRKR